MSQKKLTFRTPAGVAVYPWLNVADTQFDASGKYKVSLRMNKDDAQELINTVKEAASDAFGAKAKSATLPFKTDEDTGDIIVATSSKFKPKFVDGSGKAINDNNVPQIYSGSELKAAGTMHCYSVAGRMGVSMQLGGIQIISVSELSNSDTSYSFEPVKDGFVPSNDNAPSEGVKEEGGYNF